MTGLAITAAKLLEQIEAAKHATEKLDVPEWGEGVFTRYLTVAEQEQWLKEKEGEPNSVSAAKLLALAICDQAGSRVFSSHDALLIQPGHVLMKAFLQVLKANYMRKEDSDLLLKK